jgi:hypothetical protein
MTNENDTAYNRAIAKMQAEETERRRCFVENKRRLIEALQGTPIVSIRITFDGCGDEGCVHQPEACGAAGEAYEIPDLDIEWPVLGSMAGQGKTITLKLSAALETFADDYLQLNHGGWELEEGAYGEFRIDVSGGSVTFEYNERFIETNYLETTF